MALEIQSTAFNEGATIPKLYTCDDKNVSPALSWSEPPAGTQSLALIVDDPDAPMGLWTHWLIFNLPATARSLPQGVPTTERAAGGVQGANTGKKLGYTGPCPPPGPVHRYYFKLYALDTTLNLKPGAVRADVDKAIQGHILAEGQLMGRYGR